MCAFLTQFRHVVTSGHFDPCTLNRYQNDRKGKLNSVFECQGPCDIWGTFLVERRFSRQKVHAHAKMTATCPMDLDTQKLNSLYACDHFHTFLTYSAQSGQKLQHVEIWSKKYSSKIEKFRFDPTVRSVRYISAWTFHNLSGYMRINKI